MVLQKTLNNDKRFEIKFQKITEKGEEKHQHLFSGHQWKQFCYA